MKTIRQKAYKRQRIIKEIRKKGRTVAEVARRHGISVLAHGSRG